MSNEEASPSTPDPIDDTVGDSEIPSQDEQTSAADKSDSRGFLGKDGHEWKKEIAVGVAVAVGTVILKAAIENVAGKLFEKKK